MMSAKGQIHTAACEDYQDGRLISGRDVARVSRDRRLVTLRHAWPDGTTDARAWASIRAAAIRLAREVGARAVVSAHGDEMWLAEAG